MAIVKLPPREVTRTETLDGWELRATWRGSRPLAGPSEVTIRATDALSDAERVKGVTTGVMRRLEPVLVRMVQEVGDDHVSTWADDVIERDIQDALDKLPNAGPRSDPRTYYHYLLRLYAILEEAYLDPVTELADRLHIKRNTAKSRVRLARAWRDGHS